MATTQTKLDCPSFSIVYSILFSFILFSSPVYSAGPRTTENFGKGWKFNLGDVPEAQTPGFDDSGWRALDVPHDWSIEGKFSKENPASPGGGALPGGIGWYRKTFSLPEVVKDNLIFIEFDGVYRNSEVWINGHYLGRRPYGYSSFRYELTPFLKYGQEKNVIAVKVDNSKQPNSRWYTGSGIYRNVWLITTNSVYIDHWGVSVTTPSVGEQSATISIQTKIRNVSEKSKPVVLRLSLLDKAGKIVVQTQSPKTSLKDSISVFSNNVIVSRPSLWSVENPYLYTLVTTIECNGEQIDRFETTVGIRTFAFDSAKGFSLNGKPVKIKGVCNHHDLGCLGAAINYRALRRQLEILKEMGVNGIRTSHNPPAPELLDLCDRMGFIVMDEAFDMWKKGKTQFDYSLDWDEWHQRDIQDMVLRDRNHPCIFIWSIGNEVTEQYDKKDSSGTVIAKELTKLVKAIDTTRPVTSNCNDVDPLDPVIRSGALDLIGYSYNWNVYQDFPKTYAGKKFIGSETTSALATRNSYDMPSDSTRRWPFRWDSVLTTGNADFSCSAYDNCSAPWGSTHEETWRLIKKYPYLSGMYIWTGFDYLGEPTPYSWPARSSYFGIVDLAGFPKDAYYMYQSEWTNKPVLHLFPHWNWKQGDTVDVWAYTNCETVELFLNNRSLGKKTKDDTSLHVVWKVPFTPGVLKAIGRTGGKDILTQEIKTAGVPAKIILEADRSIITADGKDLSFVTVKIVDREGTLVPHAGNLIQFSIEGTGTIAGVDNGSQTSDESFKANERKAFNGMCLAVVQSTEKSGTITLKAISEGLSGQQLVIQSK
jgi:beta-galactosidase